MKLNVTNLQGETLREIEVPEEIFSYPYNEGLIHTAVRAHLAAKRAGTHKTKTRDEVSGSGKKLWRQKGTGRARVGSIRTPLWRGGGTVHGPQPRSYKMKLSVGEKKNALKSALSRRLADEHLMVVDSLELESHKTKALVSTLAGLGIEQKALLVDTRDNTVLDQASRNHPLFKAVDAQQVNVYDVVDRQRIVLSTRALERLVEVLGR